MNNVWRKCGHPRTLENSVGNRFQHGCRKCAKRQKRSYYYRGKGETPPLPIPFRFALAPIKRKYHSINNKVIGVRVVAILNDCDPLDRASYMLRSLRNYDLEYISEHLSISADEIERRAATVGERVRLTEHQNMYKDWDLVQGLIDEGVTEAEVKEMIGISQPGWDAAKRRGAVRV